MSTVTCIGGQRSALAIVGRNETYDLIRFQARVDDHGRHACARRVGNRTNQRAIIERREDDAIHALCGKTFDDLYLLLAIVFA